MDWFNQLLDTLSEYFAERKGLLPLIGLFLVVINFILQLIPGIGWLAASNLFLHLGLILAIVGMMLSWAL
jgi:uncharacterized membrane protein